MRRYTRMMVYQEKPPHPLPVPTREPPDVLLCQRTIQSLEQENAWLKEQLARIALNMPVAAKDFQILQGEMKGPDAPWLASFVSQPTNEELCAKVGDGMRG